MVCGDHSTFSLSGWEALHGANAIAEVVKVSDLNSWESFDEELALTVNPPPPGGRRHIGRR